MEQGRTLLVALTKRGFANVSELEPVRQFKIMYSLAQR